MRHRSRLSHRPSVRGPGWNRAPLICGPCACGDEQQCEGSPPSLLQAAPAGASQPLVARLSATQRRGSPGGVIVPSFRPLGTKRRTLRGSGGGTPAPTRGAKSRLRPPLLGGGPGPPAATDANPHKRVGVKPCKLLGRCIAEDRAAVQEGRTPPAAGGRGHIAPPKGYPEKALR